jgi:hypothetical protein
VNTECSTHPNAGKVRVATVVRSVPVRLVEVSRSGCRFECASRLQTGTSGLLAVELAGLMRIDDFRVARCQQRMGAGEVYQVGVELLRTRRLGRRTVRMAVTRIVGDERGFGHARVPVEDPPPAQNEVSGRSVTRGPPGRSDSGF